jgi:hypothetical protein
MLNINKLGCESIHYSHTIMDTLVVIFVPVTLIRAIICTHLQWIPGALALGDLHRPPSHSRYTPQKSDISSWSFHYGRYLTTVSQRYPICHTIMQLCYKRRSMQCSALQALSRGVTRFLTMIPACLTCLLNKTLASPFTSGTVSVVKLVCWLDRWTADLYTPAKVVPELYLCFPSDISAQHRALKALCHGDIPICLNDSLNSDTLMVSWSIDIVGKSYVIIIRVEYAGRNALAFWSTMSHRIVESWCGDRVCTEFKPALQTEDNTCDQLYVHAKWFRKNRRPNLKLIFR